MVFLIFSLFLSGDVSERGYWKSLAPLVMMTSKQGHSQATVDGGMSKKEAFVAKSNWSLGGYMVTYQT